MKSSQQVGPKQSRLYAHHGCVYVCREHANADTSQTPTTTTTAHLVTINKTQTNTASQKFLSGQVSPSCVAPSVGGSSDWLDAVDKCSTKNDACMPWGSSGVQTASHSCTSKSHTSLSTATNNWPMLKHALYTYVVCL